MDDAHMFNQLRVLLIECGKNKHDRAIVLIQALIENDINTRKRIRGAAVHLGMDPAHVIIILNRHEGTDPERHYWKIDEEGNYNLLD